MLDFASFTLQKLKPLDRYFSRAGTKMKQIGSHLLVKPSDNLPEPLYNGVIRHVSLVISVAFPVLHIYLRSSAQNHLELMRLEYFQVVVGNHLVQSVFKALDNIADVLICIELDPFNVKKYKYIKLTNYFLLS